MIHAPLTHSERYEALHPLLKQLFDYVRTHDLTTVPAGRISLQGDDLFINVVDAELVPAESQKLEVHEAYIDVHFPLSGTEIIGWHALNDIAQVPEAPFDTENDFALYAVAPSSLSTVKPGEFVIVWPEDAHAPIIGKGRLRKAIAKVKLAPVNG